MSYLDISDELIREAYNVLAAEDEGKVPVFLTSDLAGALVAIHDVDQDHYGEMLAEVGSSAFMLYGNAADANTVAYSEVQPPVLTPLTRYATEYIRMMSELKLYAQDELPGLAYLHRIPEFNPQGRVNFQRGGDIPF